MTIAEDLNSAIQRYDQALKDETLSEAQVDAVFEEAEKLVPNARLSELFFYGERERSREETVEEALYREELWERGGERAVLLHVLAQVQVAGSVASQAFGVAARLQDGISWKGVALAGISAGVSGGLAGSFERIAGSAFLGDVVRGALGSVVSQGIGVATRLQDKFDFAGVAAAGLGSGASGAIGLGGFEGRLVGNTVGGLANAAARSLLGGTDFGDNILAALPDIIGQTIGGGGGGWDHRPT